MRGNMKNTVQVTINAPGFEDVFPTRKGLGFQALSAKYETHIDYDCRKSDCGVCIFRVLSGMENLSKRGENENAFLNTMRADENERLACQCRIMGDVSIVIDDYTT
jgi:ferredoxin